jgi:hypothetical protein
MLQARRQLQEVSGDMYAGASLLRTIQDRLSNYREVSRAETCVGVTTIRESLSNLDVSVELRRNLLSGSFVL